MEEGGWGSILGLACLPKGVCEALRAISSNEGGEGSKWVQAFTFLTFSKTQYRYFVDFTVNCNSLLHEHEKRHRIM